MSISILKKWSGPLSNSGMDIYDLHCDALLKLQEDKNYCFTDSKNMEVTEEKLKNGKVKLQFFAIFIEPEVSYDDKFAKALEQIDLFYEKVIKPHSSIRHIAEWNQINDLQAGETGAVLVLEGADAFGNDISRLRLLYRLGVLSLGITWNNANLCADGLGESRGAGLSDFGREVVAANNEYGVLTDVAHLSVKGFWDVIETADYPIATHCNAKSICSSRRNLDDEQLAGLFQAKGLAGIVFNPPFIRDNQFTASIQDLFPHIEHMLKLGGENFIALGSDFDGITNHVTNLSHAGEYQNLIDAVSQEFGQEITEKIAWKNAHRYLTHIGES